MNVDDIHERTERNRHVIADLLDGLGPSQWSHPTLCAGWTVRHLAAHLLQPMLVGFGRFFLVSVPYRGNTAATVDHLARHLARHEPAELVALLREHAADRVDPPRVGPMGPFAETCIHLRDIARPLGLDTTVPAADWQTLLDYLVSPGAAESLVPARGLDGVTFRASDSGWSHGTGPEVIGTQEALAMAITGRDVALDDLDGPGVATLHARVRA